MSKVSIMQLLQIKKHQESYIKHMDNLLNCDLSADAMRDYRQIKEEHIIILKLVDEEIKKQEWVNETEKRAS